MIWVKEILSTCCTEKLQMQQNSSSKYHEPLRLSCFGLKLCFILCNTQKGRILLKTRKTLL